MATGLVDPSGLAASFERAAAGAGVTVHRGLDDDVLARLIKEHEVERAVISSEPDVLAVGERLRALDVDVVDVADEGEAELGVIAASAAIASTGAIAVALAAKASANRLACVAAPVQLCLVPSGALVATPADLLRPLTGQPKQLAGRLVVITGPSPSGPNAVHVALID